MAEFDSSGYSAVAAFFGGKDESKKVNEGDIAKSTSRGGSGRRGVGSARSQSAKGQANETITKRLLQVGTKRKHNHDDDDRSEGHRQSDSEEEEDGRTAIQAKPKTVSQPPDELVAAQKKKKKKKAGKKERKLAAATDKSDITPIDENAEANENSPVPSHVDKDTAKEASATAEQTAKKKRKRPKVRSRQKNIYKDKRLPQHKPDHLIPGRPNFQGRPITPETRARLNLPPSKMSRKHLVHDKNDQHTADGMGVDLAVDSFLDYGGAVDAAKQSAAGLDSNPNQVLKKKKRKKAKKPKYKNLM